MSTSVPSKKSKNKSVNSVIDVIKDSKIFTDVSIDIVMSYILKLEDRIEELEEK